VHVVLWIGNLEDGGRVVEVEVMGDKVGCRI